MLTSCFAIKEQRLFKSILSLNCCAKGREFFKIEVGDRQQWARSELKTINRLMKENERILRRMGITPHCERLPVTSECYDTLPPEKKNAGMNG